MTDAINQPNHYDGTYGMTCIEAIRNGLTKEEFLGYCKGNVLKYTWRGKTKNGLEDYLKARKHLDYMKEVIDGDKTAVRTSVQ